jgi:hypothetical protein
VERGAELVGHVGQELALELVGPLGGFLGGDEIGGLGGDQFGEVVRWLRSSASMALRAEMSLEVPR